MCGARTILLSTAILAFALVSTLNADPPDAKSLEAAYPGEIRPLMVRYCQECHNGEDAEAEIDLGAMPAWSDVRKHPRTWQKIGAMLDSGQMPPKDAEQPTDEERNRLRQWVRRFLMIEAASRAGDPGKVVLRRLNNAEYTYTLRDLTKIESLDVAREFPVDGAAGEGFTNTGNALSMSPAMVTKYLDAAKEVARHAVLLPDGIRFSPHVTPRDWTEESLAEIRAFYRQFTDRSGAERVNLQGVVFDTNDGGRLPVEKYLAATLAEREALQSGARSIEAVAQKRGLNAKYLGMLWKSLTSSEPSLLLDRLRNRWRAARPEDSASLAAEVAAWQKALWKFSTVGHIGKVGGPKAWLEPVSPIIARYEARLKIPAAEGGEVTLSLVASDTGDGNGSDFVVWNQPRLVAPGRPDVLLRDVRGVVNDLSTRRDSIFARTSRYLAAAELVQASQESAVDLAALAANHELEADALRAWLDYLGIGSAGPVSLQGHFTTKIESNGGYDFIKGWGSHQTPLLIANSSDRHVRVPGNMKPHGVAVHPSPTLRAAVGWRSTIAATLRIEGEAGHAHPECGNGVTWALELRRGATRRRLAAGIAHGGQPVKFGPSDSIAVQVGDVISLSIGPRDTNHSCDLTAIDLKLADQKEGGRTWNLAEDVSSDILAGNPHADRFGNADVWHFYTEPESGAGDHAPVIPADSSLARWQAAKSADERHTLAEQVQQLLTSAPPTDGNSPDAILRKQATSPGGPLFRGLLTARVRSGAATSQESQASANNGEWGLDPTRFGKHPKGQAIDAASLCVQAPSVIEIRLPADFAAECELVTTGTLNPESGAEGSVQLHVIAGKADRNPGLVPATVSVTSANSQWTDNKNKIAYGAPILVNEDSAARRRVEAGLEDFRQLFPAALCYTKIVPVDEVVTLTLMYREDEHLQRLMLDDAQKAYLDRLWNELHYVSRDALTLVDAFQQLMEFATQDADPKVFEPLRKPIHDRAAAFRQTLIDTEPKHLDALLGFADRAYRRPLTEAEAKGLRDFYSGLRRQEIPHDEAFRLTLARVFVAPAFLYRLEKPVPGDKQGPVTDHELASRLSYFLWSSLPDDELRQMAAQGKLHEPEALTAQMRRMLQDARTRRLATEFACQWLHIYEFDQLNEKSERHFPTFTSLRGSMYEESIRFFTDLFQNDGSVLEILTADHTFLNEDLARHYGISGVTGSEWRRVDGLRQHSRGGILAQATTLAKQSGASRTSPILRGNWISEILLGERLPRPPKDVPQLPDEVDATAGLTVRQLVEKHASDPKCSVCHRRIDPLGFSLETFDGIGRWREKDLGDLPIDTQVKTIDGAEFTGLDGLRAYLGETRRDAFVRQFCRKLLGYALGRSVQLYDEPLLAEMQDRLKANDYKLSVALETVVLSRQFREIRGRDAVYDEE